MPCHFPNFLFDTKTASLVHSDKLSQRGFFNKAVAMKKSIFALLLLVLACITSTGCATPAYSGSERGQLIARNWEFEGKQINDDIDSILLLRPAGRLTIWHIR
jgi:hypothetical protein